MKGKLVLLSATFAALFWACGDGSIEALGSDDETVLAYYTGEDNPEAMGALVSDAKQKCTLEDECKADMERANGIIVEPEPESTDSGETTGSSSSSAGLTPPLPTSSPAAITPSSNSNVTLPSSESNVTPPSSDSNVTPPPSSDSQQTQVSSGDGYVEVQAGTPYDGPQKIQITSGGNCSIAVNEGADWTSWVVSGSPNVSESWATGANISFTPPLQLDIPSGGSFTANSCW